MTELYIKKAVDEFRRLITVMGANSSPVANKLIFDGAVSEKIFGLFHIMSSFQFKNDEFLFSILPVIQHQLENLVTYIGYQTNITPFEIELFRNEVNKLKEWFRTQSISYQLLLDKLVLDEIIANLPIGCMPYEPKVGITEKEYIAGCYELIGKIRSNLINVLEPSLLKKVLEQHGHTIIIGFIPTINKRTHAYQSQHLTGFFDVRQNVVFISWKPYVSDHEVQYVLSNEYQHVAFCNLRNIINLAECTFPPEHRVIRSHLVNSYKQIEAYDFSLEDFYRASACYEPVEYYLEVPTCDHGLLLKNNQIKKLSKNRLFIPRLTISPTGSPLGMGDTYVEYTQLRENVMLYKARFATEVSKPEEKAKAFLLDMKRRHMDYQPGGIYANSDLVMYGVNPNKKARNRNEFFTQGSPGEVAERLSDLGYLPPQLLRTFFGEVCDKLSGVFEVEDYCDHPMTRCSIK